MAGCALKARVQCPFCAVLIKTMADDVALAPAAA